MNKMLIVTAATLAALQAPPTFARDNSSVHNSHTATLAASEETTVRTSEYLLAQARSYVEVIAALEADGYVVEEVKRTLLGRVRITARNTLHERELVVSRSTGEIMSDVIVTIFADTSNGSKKRQGSTTTGVNGTLSGAVDGALSGGGLDIDADVSVDGNVDVDGVPGL